MPESRSDAADDRPALLRDTSFWAMTITQFLGAFNDNLFRQLVLLLCVDQALHAGQRAQDLQGIAMVTFAAPFVLCSGFAGYLSDRTSKRKIVVLCKLAEIGITFLGLLAFYSERLTPLFIVLFLMGTHSAFFGPAKYGILPEMLTARDLPRANGIIAMTTFLAIIFGFAVAGVVKEQFAGRLWMASILCFGIATVGALTSTFVRRTPIAQAGLRFQWAALAVSPDTLRMLRQDRTMLTALLVTSLYWLIGGMVYPPTINRLGREQLLLGDSETGVLAACTGVGICIGCLVAGKLSRERVDSQLVRVGAWGLVGSLAILAVPNPLAQPGQMGPDTTLLGIYGAHLALVAVGLFAGFFSVPLQVFLQARPPDTQKGRIVGAMNLANWIGIAVSGVLYDRTNALVIAAALPPCTVFVVAAALMVPVAILYRAPDVRL
jgi:acyl-[acyl-carrier-protein]-phospholipid O-acyltransferase/long-chain-fatty-acid--[acyl-carrier-protein] ligase